MTIDEGLRMIEQKTFWTTSFVDLFEYAKVHFNISWNDANDLFFNNFLEYKGHHFVMCEEWPDIYNDDLDDRQKAVFITRQFFQAYDVPEFEEVLMDCG